MVDRKLNDWLPGKFQMFSLNKLLHGWPLPTWGSPPCRLALVSDQVGSHRSHCSSAYKKKRKRDRTTLKSIVFKFMILLNILCDTVADPAARCGGGGKKHEIYVVALISHLFMTYFYRAVGGGSSGPSTPLSPRSFVAESTHAWWKGVLCMAGGAYMADGMCGGGGVCVVEGGMWHRGMHGRGRAWQGACMAGGVRGRGRAWQGACMAGSMCCKRDDRCSGRYASY